MNEEYEQVKASIFTRFGAGVVDLLLSFFFMIFISNLIIVPIISNSDSYRTNYELYANGLKSTNLYVEDPNNNNTLVALIDKVTDSEKNVSFALDHVNEYDEALVNFYSVYSMDKVEEYQNTKKEKEIFTYNEESLTYQLIEDADINAVYTFYYNAYSDATLFYLDNNAAEKEAYVLLRKYNNINTYCSFGVALLIVYILFPMIFKHGQTIGKKLFSLRVMSAKDVMVPAKKYQVLLREGSFILVELALSYFTYFVPLIIGILFLSFNKKHLALHDYVGATVVVDGNKMNMIGVVPQDKRVSEETQDEVAEIEATEPSDNEKQA